MAALPHADGKRVTRVPRSVFLALALLASGSGLSGAGADEPAPTVPAPPATPPLAPARADAAGRRQADAEFKVARAALRTAQAAGTRAKRAAAAADARVAKARAPLAALAAEHQAVADQLAVARGRVRDLAVASYVTGGSAQSVDYLLRSGNTDDLDRRRALLDSAGDFHRDAAAAYDVARQAASAELDSAVRAVEAAEADAAVARSEAAAPASIVADRQAEVDHRKLLLDLVTAAAPVEPSDIPRLFLDAYQRAGSVMKRRSPGCRLSWTAIAGIGKIESNHGRFRGAQLTLNGDVFPRIIGIPLDGTNGTRVIRDTDGGVQDGDTVFDRAVGPLQFIPSTWARIAQDGNGDRMSDANNAYDAALATAAYLCRATRGAPVDVDEGLRTAFFSYNHSAAYVELALGWTKAYQALAPSLGV